MAESNVIENSNFVAVVAGEPPGRPELAAFDDLPLGVVLSELGQPFRFVYVNPEFCRLTGYAQADLINNPDVVHRLALTKPVALAGALPKAAAFDLSLRHQSGQSLYVNLKSGYCQVAGKRYLAAYYTDVSDRVRAVRHLVQCEEVLRETQAAAKVGSIDMDFTNGRLIWSDETFRIFGLPPNSKIPSSKLFFECIHPDDAANVFRKIDLAIANQAHLSLDYRIIQPYTQQVCRLKIEARYVAPPQGQEPSQRFMGTVRQMEVKEGNFEAETELRRAQNLLNGTREAILAINAFSTEIVLWNKGAEDLYGPTAEEALGRRLNDVIPTSYGDGLTFDKFYENLMLHQYWKGDLRQKNREGKPVIIDATFRVVSDSASMVPDVLIFNTEKINDSNYEKQANELAQTLNLIFGNIPGWVILIGLKMEIFGCNDNFAQAMGENNKDFFTGKLLNSLPMARNYLRKLEESAQQVIDEDVALTRLSETITTRTGQTFFLETSIVPLRAKGGSIQGVLFTADDITEKRLVEEQLRVTEREQERMQSLAIVQGQEEERKRVSMELHDGVGQILTAMQMKVDFLKNSRDDHDQPRNQAFSEAVSLVNNARQEVRRISYNLMPSILSDFGLEEALGNLCKSIENSSELDVDAFIDIAGRRFPEPVEIAVFRIAQEAMNNACKYSQARYLMLELSALGNQLQLIVEDNGKGFDPEKISRGNGLANLTQRARLLNGHLEIDTAPGRGTRVKAILPV